MTEAIPTVIPRPQHPISRRNLSPNALRVLYRLRDHGFIAYLVGGCVRDLWLGREPKDFDVVTDATPGQIKRLFRNCRLIGRRFRLAHIHFGEEVIEVATFRAGEVTAPDAEGEAGSPRHVKDEEGMVLRDNVFGTPEEDARRRDFTVNALCYTVTDFSLIDYVGGVSDLESGIIRTIGDPVVRFTEDPVRMLRAVRFAALLGFTIEEETWGALVSLSHTIVRSAPPRLFEELLKLFLSGEGEKSYQMMRQTGLFAALFPHFNAWLATETDCFPHTWASRAFDELDRLCQAGEKPAPQYLLGLIFGQYLEEKTAFFRTSGAPPQQAVDMAVAEFMTELTPTVLIPNKIVMLMREILLGQLRLQKTPGRQPALFAARPGFPAALAYLEFKTAVLGEKADLLTWWRGFASGEVLPPVEGGEGQPPRRKRRRRRRRRSPAPPGNASS